MKPRKPSKSDVKVRITHAEVPEGIIASVGYESNTRDKRRLIWECEDKELESALNSNLYSLNPRKPHLHFGFYDSNPPWVAAMHAAKTFDIEILTEGVTYSIGNAPSAPEERRKKGLLAEGDIPPTLEEAKQCMTPEVRQWFESQPQEKIDHESFMLRAYTAERFARHVEMFMDSTLEYEEEMRRKLADEDE